LHSDLQKVCDTKLIDIIHYILINVNIYNGNNRHCWPVERKTHHHEEEWHCFECV